jgi:DNA-directed RNA polymerase subunit RPC12/RpoP
MEFSGGEGGPWGRSPLLGTTGDVPDKHVPHYYEQMGEQHDGVLRCQDCRRLDTYVRLIAARGCPACGSRRVVEVKTLSTWEWLRIRLGLLDFPHRRAFLKEFHVGLG